MSYLDVQENGLIDLEVFKATLRPDTILVSVMFVNNEIGVIQPVPRSVKSAEKGLFFTSMPRKHSVK